MAPPARKASRGRLIAVSCAVWLVVNGAPIFGLNYGLTDYLRRGAILENGTRANGVVDHVRYGKSKTGGLVCTVILAYSVNGVRHTTEWRGCHKDVRNGQKTPIAFDPAQPGAAIALREGRWPENAPSSLFILALIFTLTTAGLCGALVSALRQPDD